MTRTRITTQAASGTGIYYCKIWTPIGWTYSLIHIYYFRIRRPESRYVDKICFPCLIAYVHTTDREEKETKVTCQIGLQCNSFTSSIRRRGCGRYVVEDTEYTVPGRSPTHTYLHAPYTPVGTRPTPSIPKSRKYDMFDWASNEIDRSNQGYRSYELLLFFSPTHRYRRAYMIVLLFFHSWISTWKGQKGDPLEKVKAFCGGSSLLAVLPPRVDPCIGRSY